MRLLLITLVLPVLPFGLLAAPVPKEKEKEKVKDEVAIQGTWQVEKFEMGGPGGPPPQEIAKMRLIFKDGKVAADHGDGKPDEIDYKLDPAAKPKAIDLIEKGRPMLAIYELDGDTLTLCVSEGGQMGARPAEFKADGKNIAVITLKRVKEEKKDK